MKRLARVSVWLVALALVTTSCGDDEDPAGARDLWNRVHVADYPKWARPIDYPTRKPSFTAHKREVEIFMNPMLAEATRTPGLTAWPVGSIVVKEGYEDGHLAIVASMEKRESGWFYAEYDRVGIALYSGTPDICTDCHGNSKNDALWSLRLAR